MVVSAQTHTCHSVMSGLLITALSEELVQNAEFSSVLLHTLMQRCDVTGSVVTFVSQTFGGIAPCFISEHQQGEITQQGGRGGPMSALEHVPERKGKGGRSHEPNVDK